MTQPHKDRARDVRSARSHGPFAWRPCKNLWAFLFAVALVLQQSNAPVRAEPLPLPPAEQAKVNQAMLHGVIFLKNSQGSDGTWQATDKPHRVGYAALPAMTLLECGMPVKHSSIQRAAAFIDEFSAKEGNTYDLALAIMFLDRLGGTNEDLLRAVREKKVIDQRIQVLALRLIAGQTVTGGWTYSCPVLSVREHGQLLKALEDPRPDRTKLAPWIRKLAVFQDPAKLMVKPAPADAKKTKKKTAQPEPPKEEPTDNSNSHFAALALWVAQRHEVPVERSFKLVGKRFRTSQNPDGGWGYKYKLEGGEGGSPAMTCAGLIGLALERGLTPAPEAAGASAVDKSAAALAGMVGGPGPLNAFLAAKNIQVAAAREIERKKRTEEPVTLKGFQALANHVGQPAGRIENIPIGDLYFLWALERVAMIYDLQTIGDKDWYRWGAEMMVANLKPEGFWDVKTFDGAASEVINSCFALLFLRQANLADDLTAKLQADPTLLDKPLVAKKELPPEAKPQTPPAAPPAETKSGPENSPQASLANPKSSAPSAGAPTAGTRPSPPPESPSPSASTSVPSTPQDSNKALLWLGAGLGIVLIGVASTLLIMGMRQKKGHDEEPEPRRSPAKKREDGANPKNGAGRKAKIKRKEET